MTISQTRSIEISEIRQKLNELSAKETLESETEAGGNLMTLTR